MCAIQIASVPNLGFSCTQRHSLLGRAEGEYSIHSLKSPFISRAGFWPLLNSEVFAVGREWKREKEQRNEIPEGSAKSA